MQAGRVPEPGQVRLDILKEIYCDSRANAGQKRPSVDDPAVLDTVLSWDEVQLRYVPTWNLVDAYLYAQENRSNSGSACNPQNLRAAHAELVQQGRAETLVERAEPDPFCARCKGLGWEFTESGVRRCGCQPGDTPVPRYEENVSRLMRFLAEERGAIENPEAEAKALRFLYQTGWSLDDLFQCWTEIEAETGNKPGWVTVREQIAARYVRQEFPAVFERTARIAAEARAESERRSRDPRLPETMTAAGALLETGLWQPRSMAQLARESWERKQKAAAEQAANRNQED